MKTIQELNNSKVPVVAIDDSLNKFQDKIMFPEKLEKANQMLKTAQLPTKKQRS